MLMADYQAERLPTEDVMIVLRSHSKVGSLTAMVRLVTEAMMSRDGWSINFLSDAMNLCQIVYRTVPQKDNTLYAELISTNTLMMDCEVFE